MQGEENSVHVEWIRGFLVDKLHSFSSTIKTVRSANPAILGHLQANRAMLFSSGLNGFKTHVLYALALHAIDQRFDFEGSSFGSIRAYLLQFIPVIDFSSSDFNKPSLMLYDKLAHTIMNFYLRMQLEPSQICSDLVGTDLFIYESAFVRWMKNSVGASSSFLTADFLWDISSGQTVAVLLSKVRPDLVRLTRIVFGENLTDSDVMNNWRECEVALTVFGLPKPALNQLNSQMCMLCFAADLYTVIAAHIPVAASRDRFVAERKFDTGIRPGSSHVYVPSSSRLQRIDILLEKIDQLTRPMNLPRNPRPVEPQMENPPPPVPAFQPRQQIVRRPDPVIMKPEPEKPAPVLEKPKDDAFETQLKIIKKVPSVQKNTKPVNAEASDDSSEEAKMIPERILKSKFSSPRKKPSLATRSEEQQIFNKIHQLMNDPEDSEDEGYVTLPRKRSRPTDAHMQAKQRLLERAKKKQEAVELAKREEQQKKTELIRRPKVQEKEEESSSDDSPPRRSVRKRIVVDVDNDIAGENPSKTRIVDDGNSYLKIHLKRKALLNEQIKKEEEPQKRVSFAISPSVGFDASVSEELPPPKPLLEVSELESDPIEHARKTREQYKDLIPDFNEDDFLMPPKNVLIPAPKLHESTDELVKKPALRKPLAQEKKKLLVKEEQNKPLEKKVASPRKSGIPVLVKKTQKIPSDEETGSSKSEEEQLHDLSDDCASIDEDLFPTPEQKKPIIAPKSELLESDSFEQLEQNMASQSSYSGLGTLDIDDNDRMHLVDSKINTGPVDSFVETERKAMKSSSSERIEVPAKPRRDTKIDVKHSLDNIDHLVDRVSMNSDSDGEDPMLKLSKSVDSEMLVTIPLNTMHFQDDKDETNRDKKENASYRSYSRSYGQYSGYGSGIYSYYGYPYTDEYKYSGSYKNNYSEHSNIPSGDELEIEGVSKIESSKKESEISQGESVLDMSESDLVTQRIEFDKTQSFMKTDGDGDNPSKIALRQGKRSYSSLDEFERMERQIAADYSSMQTIPAAVIQSQRVDSTGTDNLETIAAAPNAKTASFHEKSRSEMSSTVSDIPMKILPDDSVTSKSGQINDMDLVTMRAAPKPVCEDRYDSVEVSDAIEEEESVDECIETTVRSSGNNEQSDLVTIAAAPKNTADGSAKACNESSFSSDQELCEDSFASDSHLVTIAAVPKEDNATLESTKCNESDLVTILAAPETQSKNYSDYSYSEAVDDEEQHASIVVGDCSISNLENNYISGSNLTTITAAPHARSTNGSGDIDEAQGNLLSLSLDNESSMISKRRSLLENQSSVSDVPMRKLVCDQCSETGTSMIYKNPPVLEDQSSVFDASINKKFSDQLPENEASMRSVKSSVLESQRSLWNVSIGKKFGDQDSENELSMRSRKSSVLEDQLSVSDFPMRKLVGDNSETGASVRSKNPPVLEDQSSVSMKQQFDDIEPENQLSMGYKQSSVLENPSSVSDVLMKKQLGDQCSANEASMGSRKSSLSDISIRKNFGDQDSEMISKKQSVLENPSSVSDLSMKQQFDDQESMISKQSSVSDVSTKHLSDKHSERESLVSNLYKQRSDDLGRQIEKEASDNEFSIGSDNNSEMTMSTIVAAGRNEYMTNSIADESSCKLAADVIESLKRDNQESDHSEPDFATITAAPVDTQSGSGELADEESVRGLSETGDVLETIAAAPRDILCQIENVQSLDSDDDLASTGDLSNSKIHGISLEKTEELESSDVSLSMRTDSLELSMKTLPVVEELEASPNEPSVQGSWIDIPQSEEYTYSVRNTCNTKPPKPTSTNSSSQFSSPSEEQLDLSDKSGYEYDRTKTSKTPPQTIGANSKEGRFSTSSQENMEKTSEQSPLPFDKVESSTHSVTQSLPISEDSLSLDSSLKMPTLTLPRLEDDAKSNSSPIESTQELNAAIEELHQETFVFSSSDDEPENTEVTLGAIPIIDDISISNVKTTDESPQNDSFALFNDDESSGSFDEDQDSGEPEDMLNSVVTLPSESISSHSISGEDKKPFVSSNIVSTDSGILGSPSSGTVKTYRTDGVSDRSKLLLSSQTFFYDEEKTARPPALDMQSTNSPQRIVSPTGKETRRVSFLPEFTVPPMHRHSQVVHRVSNTVPSRPRTDEMTSIGKEYIDAVKKGTNYTELTREEEKVLCEVLQDVLQYTQAELISAIAKKLGVSRVDPSVGKIISNIMTFMGSPVKQESYSDTDSDLYF